MSGNVRAQHDSKPQQHKYKLCTLQYSVLYAFFAYWYNTRRKKINTQNYKSTNNVNTVKVC